LPNPSGAFSRSVSVTTTCPACTVTSARSSPVSSTRSGDQFRSTRANPASDRPVTVGGPLPAFGSAASG
jgi:hypothetical protein